MRTIRFLSFSLLTFNFTFSILAIAGEQREVLPTHVTPLSYTIDIDPHPDQLTFDGHSQVALRVNEATKSIVLNAADLEIKSVKLGQLVPTSVLLDPKIETLTLTFADVITPGTYTLDFIYSGKIFLAASGLFALDYNTPSGTKRGLYTQFENADARRFFPCWDEPGIKATFTLSAKVPKSLMAVSNMPIASQKDAGQGFQTVRFAQTPKMSTYLLFFSMGDFERVSKKVGGVDIGIVVKRGDKPKAAFALDATAKLLPYYNNYFGTPYPLPKLDLIAASGTSQTFGAMENWGAIFYFDRVLLIDKATSTDEDLRRVFIVIAHEMAHQWFGNLVTMDWWDNLWLNEGFATWMENNAANHFYPQWRVWLSSSARSIAMDMDAKTGTHPIVQTILTVGQASQAFDRITYKKGGEVIRMLESYVGSDVFKTGVRNYMKKYAYQNTQSDDLWREIDAVSSRKIADIAHEFTLQQGIPLIEVTTGPDAWKLSQSRFSFDNSTPEDTTWQVPVDAVVLGTSRTWKGTVTRGHDQSIPRSANASLLLNPDESAYYRTRYDDAAFASLLPRFQKLDAAAQMGLLDDSFAFGAAGYAPLTQYLALSTHAVPSMNPIVLTQITSNLAYIDFLYTDLPGQPRYRAFALERLKPLFEKVGWIAKKGENANTPALRASLITTLARLGDEAALKQAFAYFDQYLANPSSLSADLRATVLRVVGSNGDEARFNQLLGLAHNAKSFTDQQLFYRTLGQNKNIAIAQKALNLALDPLTPKTLGPDVISSVSNKYPMLAFDFVLAHPKWLKESIETFARYIFLPDLTLNSFDPAMIIKLDDYAQKQIPVSARQSVEKAKGVIASTIEMRTKRLAAVDAWLAARLPVADAIDVLPKNVTPLHYNIAITPHADTLTFDGNADIDIQVNTESSRITLNAAKLDFKKVSLENGATPTVSMDPNIETATLRFDKPLQPGRYTLHIEYSGLIYRAAAGLFALDYPAGNQTKRSLFTQFENASARRMFPSWDEPAIKATFQLSATIPSELMPVSNTPIASSKSAQNGLQTVVFEKTPKMSTYLLFFGLGDFERVARKVNGIDLGAIVKRGDGAKATFALDAATEILPYYENYFGVKYPLAKLDMIAAPGTSQFFSAMENWGAIFYFDRVLLADPANTTAEAKRRIYGVVAHEIAHQWFGNLVTMDWWDNLWLNEGFASWIQNVVTDDLHPDWKVWQSDLGRKAGAMAMDSRIGTHPIIQPILNVFQASQAFDDITYRKGAAVVRMLEAYAGRKYFRDGVRAYIKKYAYQNTQSDDLWREVDAVSPNKITQMAHDFTLQAGVPLIDVKRADKGWHLEQGRFAIDDSTPADRSWQVPVDAQFLSAQAPWKGSVSRNAPAELDDAQHAGVALNTTQTGYYRTRYSEDDFAQINTKFKSLNGTAQLGILDDAYALGCAGYAPLSNFLMLASQVSPDMEPLAQMRIVNGLVNIDAYYKGLPGREDFRVFARKLLRPLFDHLTWTPKGSEDPNRPQLRAGVTVGLAVLGDAAIIAEANRYFDGFLKDPSTLSAELRGITRTIVGQTADAKRWSQVLDLATHAQSTVEKQQFYEMLGLAKDPALAQKALQLAMDARTPSTIRPDLLTVVSASFPERAFDFARQHHEWLMSVLDLNSISRFVPGLAERSFERSMIQKIEAYGKKHIPSSAFRPVRKAQAGIKYAADIREKRIPEVTAWLKAQR